MATVNITFSINELEAISKALDKRVHTLRERANSMDYAFPNLTRRAREELNTSRSVQMRISKALMAMTALTQEH